MFMHQPSLFKRMKTMTAVLAIATLFVVSFQPALAYDTPQFTSVRPDSMVFDPTASTNNQGTLRFSVDSEANVRAYITDANHNVVRSNLYPNGGFLSVVAGVNYATSWDGRRDNGQLVEPSMTATNPHYLFFVEARNKYTNVVTDTSWTRINVQYGVNPPSPTTAPVVSGVSANPSTINTTLNQTTTISYYLDRTVSNVTVTIFNGNNPISLTGTGNVGLNNVSWNGRDNSNNIVNPGSYSFLVTATNSSGQSGYAYGPTPITVTNTGGGGTCTAPVLSNVMANPSSFNPNTGSTNLNFYVDKNSQISIKIYDQYNNLVRNLPALATTPYAVSGSGTVSWNGTNNSNSIVSNGTYTFQVTANAYAPSGDFCGSDTKSGYVTVGTIIDNVDKPNITNLWVSPNPFNPDNQSAKIYYYLDKSANVTMEVLDVNNNIVRTLLNNSAQNAGNYEMTWSESTLSNGNYTIRVKASNSYGTDTETVGITVSRGGVNYDMPHLSGVSVSPNPFNPNTQTARIDYTLDKTANVTVEILGYNTYGYNEVIRTLVDNLSQGSGYHYISWNGVDRFGNAVSNGTYTVRIRASNSYGTDTRTISVTVNRSGQPTPSGDIIKNLTVVPAVFNPNNQNTSLYYNLNQSATVKVEVLDPNGNSIRTLVDQLNQTPGSAYQFAAVWNGRNSSGSMVSDNMYRFRITATSGSETEVAIAYVEVDTDGIIDGDSCAGFTDVSIDSPYCKAIELMKELGIFGGYPDGTFRPYQPINRAETTKVIVLASNIALTTNSMTNLGFWDTDNNAWYAPYIRTAKLFGIIQGYPDGSFRPEQTVNRVELLKIFLEASNVSLPACSYAPYLDTPAYSWYSKYVCFAKTHNLMHDDGTGHFQPGTPMTRGDVADLFYQFEKAF
jgi:flagellar hook assembly protein FlgD